ncbi:hypothetical protein C8Q76DRAFT_411181 [Earliella scabrosa]|nr:hypothetical protein C8Q76DRAFT_411181 [Earliella scabrosa]
MISVGLLILTVCGFVPRLIVVACLVEVVSVVPFPGSAHHSWTHRSIARARSSRGSSCTPRWVARHRRRSPRQRFSAACLARTRLQRWIGSRVDFHRYSALASSSVMTSGMDVTSACTRLFPAWLCTVRVDRLDALNLSCAYRQDSTPSCTCTYLYYYDMADGRPDARPVPSPFHAYQGTSFVLRRLRPCVPKACAARFEALRTLESRSLFK